MDRIGHVVDTTHFHDHGALGDLFSLAQEMEQLDQEPPLPTTPSLRLEPRARPRILVADFHEPSSRTYNSFSSAMVSLGGQVIGTNDAKQDSSAAKGEWLEDEIRVYASYGDAIVLRHPEEGAARRAAAVSRVPVINAGDGAGEHPTQALTDLYTIRKHYGRMDELNVAMVGDLLYGRTVHSLARLLSSRKGIHLTFVAPEPLRMREDVRAYLQGHGVPFKETDDLEAAAASADVLYATRIQGERFQDPAEYGRLKGIYAVTPAILKGMREGAMVMHPLPRVGEISPEVDADPRAWYFRQAENGIPVRRALLKVILDGYPK